ncbi:cyclodeaminase/cyclohydrolase family protein [Natroniella acetigena]|uniref:cyclodeaminase/cyclohydrolase family protein n=1 Tax=Natroniella acetigena TaxID=52004 RepID=UPI00200A3B4F|nr:cyclodeaminase/cyclohydrolase family protein [Natroniella acetigena]MCK8826828.1 cyclodeaminase/cyclohydrolase family protein [Natroniella acetigena]
MIQIITDKSIKEFAELIGSTKETMPGGGPTIAITALLAVQLLKLTYNISNIKDYQEQKLALEQLEDKLLEAIDDDINAFVENTENHFTDQEQLQEIINVPLSIVHNALITLKIAEEIKYEINSTVKADYKVAIFNLIATCKGGISIIESNYSFFPAESEYLAQAKEKVADFKEQLNNYENNCC